MSKYLHPKFNYEIRHIIIIEAGTSGLIFFFFWLCWVFVAACGLFSSCGEWELLFVVVRGLLIAVASLIAENGL